MEQLINSVKTAEVAELPKQFLLQLDLQQFSDDLGGDDGGAAEETIDENLEADDDLDTGDEIEDGEEDQGVANPETTPPAQDDKTNAAFAQMRRDKEAYEAQINSMNAMIAQQYGHMGITTFEQYQQAIQEQQQEAERQQYLDAGLPEDLVDKLSKVDQVLQQAETEKFNRLLSDNYIDLQKEYPELVKAPEDIPPEVWQKWNDGKTGLSLTDAYELVNKKAIREHLQAVSKQSTLNKVNSKSHLRGNGGEGADDVDLTSIPPDTLRMYRQMFSKELRTGKMKEADFVKHYKKSQN
jgi:hypothetical protein